MAEVTEVTASTVAAQVAAMKLWARDAKLKAKAAPRRPKARAEPDASDLREWMSRMDEAARLPHVERVIYDERVEEIVAAMTTEQTLESMLEDFPQYCLITF